MTNWYGTADRSVQDIDEEKYLDGNKALILETRDGWNRDGVEFDVRMDAGVKVLDFRTLDKNSST